MRTEFAFDIDQLSHQRFAPAGYLEKVGLQVPQKQLERAFFETYGLTLRSQLGHIRPALQSYRSSVCHFIPRIAYAEALIHQHDFPADGTGPEFQKFQERLAQADYAGEWKQYRHKPGFGTHLLAFEIRIIPKVGVFSILAIRGPTAATEGKYVTSMNNTDDAFSQTMTQLRQHPDTGLGLPNLDLDTGAEIQPGTYRRTDQTYATLLHRLTADPNRRVPAGLQRNVLAYYANAKAPNFTKKNSRDWARVQRELPLLQSMQTVSPQKAGGSPPLR